MSFDILIRCFPALVGNCPLFLCSYGFLKMAYLMLCRTAYMIVKHHYPFDRFGFTPCTSLSPGPHQIEP